MIGINIKIKEEANVAAAFKRLATDRGLYTDMILKAYSMAIDAAFRKQGFGTWPPLQPSTKRRRRGGRKTRGEAAGSVEYRNHYLLPSAAGVTAGFPANTWTAALRDFAAGRTIAQAPLQLGRGAQNIRIRGGPWYGGYALDLRPLSETIMDKVSRMMQDRIEEGIIRNIETKVVVPEVQ